MKIILEEQTPHVIGKVNIEKDTKLIQYIIEYCKTFENPGCLGMASNQIKVRNRRIKKRFFVYDWPQNKEFEAILEPEIIERIGNPSIKTEACLSWPGKTVLAKRYDSITIQYIDIQGNEVTEKVKGFKAQIFQHELDHLDGVPERIIDKDDERLQKKERRNDLCDCGSGKKFKKCCYKPKMILK